MSTCKACSQPLVLELDPDDFDEATSSSVGGSSGSVPDDLWLPCGCHFHWQCLLDESQTIALTLNCPSCSAPLAAFPAGPSATNIMSRNRLQRPQILTHYINEGGIQDNLDILPLITEEAYLSAHPSARPARAYMTMCAEGDIVGIIELVRTIQEDCEDDQEEDRMSAQELLRYQDPLDGMMSALHVALLRGQEEVVWLLLWLASGLRSERFPSEVVQAAQRFGATRDFAANGADIRALKDERGQNARFFAETLEGQWPTLLNAGVFEV